MHETVSMFTYSAIKNSPKRRPRIFGVKPGNEFGLGFDQVERHAIGLRHRRDDVDDEADELRADEPPGVLRVHDAVELRSCRP